MNNINLFPQVIEKSEYPENELINKKSAFHEKLLYRYLILKMGGWGIKDFLDNEGIKNVALYAVTDFTRLFLDDLDKSNDRDISVMVFDRNVKAFPFGVNKQSVILPSELVYQYTNRKIQKIIVMSIVHENQIIDELTKKGISLNDIISFVSVLYS